MHLDVNVMKLCAWACWLCAACGVALAVPTNTSGTRCDDGQRGPFCEACREGYGRGVGSIATDGCERCGFAAAAFALPTLVLAVVAAVAVRYVAAGRLALDARLPRFELTARACERASAFAKSATTPKARDEPFDASSVRPSSGAVLIKMTSGKEYVVAISAPEEPLERGAGAPPSAETIDDDQDDDASEDREIYQPDAMRILEYWKVLFNFVQIVDSVGAAIKVEWPRGCESETVPPPPRVPH